MKSPQLVSVLINNYNKEKYCLNAVKSILNQTYKNLEVIFYDDNSNDNSVKKIKEIKTDKLTIILNKKRSKKFSYNQINGIKKAFNKSRGNIICLLDSDDFFSKKKIYEVYKHFKSNKSHDVVYDLPILYFLNKRVNAKKNNYFKRKNKWPKFPPTSCISFKRKAFKNAITKISVLKFEELWFDFRICTYFGLKKNQFNLINKPLTYYRQYNDSYDKKYKKFINREWWKRRDQAFEFIKFLDKNKYKKNTHTFDFIITNLINKFY